MQRSLSAAWWLNSSGLPAGKRNIPRGSRMAVPAEHPEF